MYFLVIKMNNKLKSLINVIAVKKNDLEDDNIYIIFF